MRQLFREFVVAKRRADEESERDMVVAWNTAAMSRMDRKLPSIKQLLGDIRKGPAKRQSWIEQRAAIGMIAARFKIPVQRMKLSEITRG